MTAFLNAEPYTHSKERRGYRNGYKPRVLKTRVGRLELMVPKDREVRFQTELFEKYQRSEKVLVPAITEMYVHGVPIRKIRKNTEELCGLDISKSQVSQIAKGLDNEVRAWQRCQVHFIRNVLSRAKRQDRGWSGNIWIWSMKKADTVRRSEGN